ncbi:hypothetical protein AYO44_10250 [Planctomycetaceae bacterium SCGC AG-212-F19]|nr:hypothetical protein AYO44_10250 [Planctomycetaceae bacterium SCGC AG-212-F19]
MKPHHAGMVAAGWFVMGVALCAAQEAKPVPPKADLAKPDFTQSETPRKPLPKWIKTDEAGKQVFIDQGLNTPSLKGYQTPEGIKLEIAADHPTVVNPVGMAFGDDGSLFVLEWLAGGKPAEEVTETVTYKDGSKRQFTTLKKPVKDVVKLLRDTKGSGVYDQAKVILEDDLPSGLLLHDGWLYLSGRGTVRRWKLAEVLDRPADKPQPPAQVIAQGFGGFGHRQVSGLTIGNDGWLYITAGADDHYVEGSDGSRATVLKTGAVFRCRPDGSRIQVYSIGYCNPYRGIAFDAAFNAFHADNDAGQGKFSGCRLMHVAEESDFGWRVQAGGRGGQPDPIRAAVGGELPGKLPPLARTGKGAPSGLCIYNDSQFPSQYRGLLYYPDVVRKSIRAYRVGPVGSTFEVTVEFDFLKSDDPLFRPCQVAIGPDGAMYICDWRTDSTGAGAFAGDSKHGRIYRVTWGGTPEHPGIPRRDIKSWARFPGMAKDDLLIEFSSDVGTDRFKAQQQVAKLGAPARNDLLDMVADSKAASRARIAALGALNSLWNDEVKEEFLGLLYAGDPDIRRLAAEGLALNCKQGDNTVDAALLQTLGDQEMAPRRAIVLAVGRIAGVSSADSLANTFKSFKEDDPWLYDAVLRAIERLGKPGIDKLVGVAMSGVEKDFDRVVEAFRMLRTRAAADAIPELLNYPHLTIPQRVNLLKSYNNYLLDPPVALAPVFAYLDKHKDEPALVKLAALEVLTMPGAPRTEKTDDLALVLLTQTDIAFRLSVIQMIEIGRLARTSFKLTGILAEADRPTAERVAIVKALRVLGDKGPVTMVKDIASRGGADETQLRVEALRTLAVLEPAAGQDLAKTLLGDKDADVKKEAVVVLGSHPAGAKLIAEALLAKKLPSIYQPLVVEALRNHVAKQPELDKLLAEVMKLPKE